MTVLRYKYCIQLGIKVFAECKGEGQCTHERPVVGGLLLTSEGGLQVDLGLFVQVLHARGPGAGQKDVLLLVPRGRVVHRPLALIVQAGHGCEDTHTNTHTQFCRLGQRS